MFLFRLSFSSLSPLRRHFVRANARTFSSSATLLKFRRVLPNLPNEDENDNSPSQILQRVSYYLSEGVPHVALGYFKKKMTDVDVLSPARFQLFEAVLDLFLRKKCFLDAEKIIARMDNEGFRLSQPLRAKVLTIQHVRGELSREVFLNALQELFATSGAQFGDTHFHDLLHHFVRAENSMDVLERAVALYIEAKGAEYWLDPLSVAFMIARHLALGNKADAERWLEYHSRRPRPAGDPYPELSYPYTAYIHGLIENAPAEDPALMYDPVLDRMARDGAWPDTAFINVLINAELEHGHVDAALTLYDTLREHGVRSVFPDEVTFSQLFSAAGRLARRARALGMEPAFPFPPRTLFREMIELHTLVAAGRIAGRAPVLTQVSLGPALWQFVVAGDYAGACVAMRMCADLHIPFDERAVIDPLVVRCKREAATSRLDGELSWADVFLNLRDTDRERLRREPPSKIERQMLDIAKRALVMSDVAKTLGEAAGEDARPPPAQPDDKSFQEIKKERMRVWRLRLVDTLLARALGATFLFGRSNKLPRTHVVMDELAQEAIQKAEEDMIPTVEQIKSGVFAPQSKPSAEETSTPDKVADDCPSTSSDPHTTSIHEELMDDCPPTAAVPNTTLAPHRKSNECL